MKRKNFLKKLTFVMLNIFRWLGLILWPALGLSLGVSYALEGLQKIGESHGEDRGLALFYLYPFWGAVCLVGLLLGLVVGIGFFVLFKKLNSKLILESKILP
jgi:FtsH-binding integral membrane protein